MNFLIPLRENILKNNQRKYFLILSVFIFMSTAVVFMYDHAFFSSYLGNINPVILSVVLIVTGLFSNVLIDGTIKSNFKIQTKRKETVLYVLFGLIWACVLIPVDVIYKLPVELNEIFPKSIVFYPLLAFYVELLFHLLPFSIMILIFRIRLFAKINEKNKIIIAAVIVLFAEPVYQVTLPFLTNYHISLTVFVAIYSIIFNSLQMIALVRKNSVMMISIRISQYAVWHIIWGVLRIKFL